MDNYQPHFNIAQLIAKHLRDELTAAENNELEQWLQSEPHNFEIFKKLSDESFAEKQLDLYVVPETEKSKAWKNIVKKTGFKSEIQKPSGIKRWFPHVAAVLLLISISLLLTQSFYKKKETNNTVAQQPIDLLPGSNKAVLTLADGSKINLDDTRNGKIATQQHAEIDKSKNGQVVYEADHIAVSDQQAVAMNTLTTPRGGQYEVVLPDGTRVWLNAASSLTYPTVFSGKDRRVELTGEAYFEVAKNAASPFFVKTAGQTVEVLGTHFNINSYLDEKVTKTTLLEGSVKVTGNNNQLMVKLKPGQQAVNSINAIDIKTDADMDEAVAWKNGKFQFRNTDLHTIMRQLSRWYDVDVEYLGDVAEKHYQGRISRNVPVSEIFQILKTSGINFTINGRKIIVRS
jgi:ferric-dicitrate binding protein FerR (iron transport regulator)